VPYVKRKTLQDDQEGETAMSIYTIVLFLHVSGAIGYFIGMGTCCSATMPFFE